MAAEYKISDLPSAAAQNGTEIVEALQNGDNVQLNLSDILSLLNLATVGTITSGTWSAKVAKRVKTITTNANIDVDADLFDCVQITAQAGAAAINAPTGTPVRFQELVYCIKDNGVAKALTYNAIFRAIGVTLPANTTAGKITYLFMVYNFVDTKWDVVDVKTQP